MRGAAGSGGESEGARAAGARSTLRFMRLAPPSRWGRNPNALVIIGNLGRSKSIARPGRIDGGAEQARKPEGGACARDTGSNCLRHAALSILLAAAKRWLRSGVPRGTTAAPSGVLLDGSSRGRQRIDGIKWRRGSSKEGANSRGAHVPGRYG